MKEEDRIFLLHIDQSIERIWQYTTAGRSDFFANTKTQDAVLRNLEIIGEAVKNLSKDLRQTHDQVPWRQIAGLRDRLIHGYFAVNLELVYEVIAKDLPELQRTVRQLLGQ